MSELYVALCETDSGAYQARVGPTREEAVTWARSFKLKWARHAPVCRLQRVDTGRMRYAVMGIPRPGEAAVEVGRFATRQEAREACEDAVYGLNMHAAHVADRAAWVTLDAAAGPELEKAS